MTATSALLRVTNFGGAALRRAARFANLGSGATRYASSSKARLRDGRERARVLQLTLYLLQGNDLGR